MDEKIKEEDTNLRGRSGLWHLRKQTEDGLGACDAQSIVVATDR